MPMADRSVSHSQPVKPMMVAWQNHCYRQSPRVRSCWRTRPTIPTRSEHLQSKGRHGPIFLPRAIGREASLSANGFTDSAISLSVSSANSNSSEASQPVTTKTH
uniref:A.tumefaciens Ti plasmid DNA insertion sequence IS869 n=1 Tax=Agrobacterium tumefaciens TaxID=358 RepID=Q00428_AGRTU|nr:unnamed protein product [Agrobacterium tumefaciens]